jgi:hypothetical protein
MVSHFNLPSGQRKTQQIADQFNAAEERWQSLEPRRLRRRELYPDRLCNRVAYVIEYSPEAEDHMRWLTMRQQRIVLDTVDRQLLHQPNMETRNRKPMRPNPVAP